MIAPKMGGRQYARPPRSRNAVGGSNGASGSRPASLRPLPSFGAGRAALEVFVYQLLARERRTNPYHVMHYVEIADLYINLDHVAYIRKEEHVQLGTVVAIHFTSPDDTPLYIGEQHYDELGALLLDPKRVQEA